MRNKSDEILVLALLLAGFIYTLQYCLLHNPWGVIPLSLVLMFLWIVNEIVVPARMGACYKRPALLSPALTILMFLMLTIASIYRLVTTDQPLWEFLLGIVLLVLLWRYALGPWVIESWIDLTSELRDAIVGRS
jgi:hypothetical protein